MTQQHYVDQFSYSRDLIEELLPGLWDEDYAFGTRSSEGEPDADMPRGSYKDPRKATNWIAHMCDVQIAWANCKTLTDAERAAVFMRFGLNYDQWRIGEAQGVTQRAVSYRITNAIEKLTRFLDGEEQDQ